MAETLGSLCDKLTIVKLKEFHTENDALKLKNLKAQSGQLQNEINGFIADAISGNIHVDQLVFNPNKVYKKKGNQTRNFNGEIGETFANLAQVNCDLWHEQEKVYEFDQVAVDQKDVVVKNLAVLNLERNKCMHRIDQLFQEMILNIHEN